MTRTAAAAEPSGTRSRLLEVAGDLLAGAGPDAVTTRAVARAAGVQPPAIYRLFGDKDGLLDAVAEHAYARYAAGKSVDPRNDPLDDFRAGWDDHIAFGLAHPGVVALLAEPARAARSGAAARGREVLLARVRRLAAAGRLRVGEAHVADLTHAAATGVLLTLLAAPPDRRDLALADTAYRAVVGEVVGEVPGEVLGDAVATGPVDAPATSPGAVAAAAALRAAGPDLPGLTPPERHLLADWLDRVTATATPARPG